MKKIITLTLAITSSLALNAQTQIGNSGFEDWESVSGGSEPVNWNGFLTPSGPSGITAFAQNQMGESTDIRPGSSGTKSVRIWSRQVPIVNVIANGNMTLGQINMGSTTANHANNYNISRITNPNHSEVMTERPDSIVFWVKFTPAGSHNGEARVKATIHNNNEYRDPEDAASQNYVVGTAELNYSSTGGQWVRKSIPFNYNGPASDAHFILITFTTNKTPGGGAGNDQVWVDDVELVYVPKPSFSASSVSGCEGSVINFTNESEHYPTSYTWDFPGGTPATSTDINPSVSYATAGTYDVTLTATNQWGSKTVTLSNHIEIEACAGIKNNVKSSSVSVYPNPTNGIVTVSDIEKNTQYTILSLSGEIVGKGEVSVNSNKIDMTTIQNGFYLVQFEEGQNIRTISIVKQ